EEPHYQERQPEGEDEDVLLGYACLDLADRPREGLTRKRDAVGDAVDYVGVYPVTRRREVQAQVGARVVDSVQPPDLKGREQPPRGSDGGIDEEVVVDRVDVPPVLE